MAHVKNDILNRLIKMLKEPHNNILSNYKKETGLCNYPVSRDEQTASITEKEKATAEMKALKDAFSSKQ